MKEGIFIAFFCALMACTDSKNTALFEASDEAVSPEARHAVHDERLHTMMNRMNNVMQERFLTEPELDAEQRKYAQRMAKTAQELAQTLDAVAATASSLQLNAAKKATFQALTEKLRKLADSLQQQTQQNRMAGISETLEQMSTTCSACHSLYRQQ